MSKFQIPAVNQPSCLTVVNNMSKRTHVAPEPQRAKANIGTAPSVAAVAVEFPPHQVSQSEAMSGLTGIAGRQFDRFGESAGVEKRRLALPLAQYASLSGFTEANDIYIDVAMALAERAILAALDAADLEPADVDVVFSTTVTGLAVPTVEARLALRLGLRPDVKRIPLFGLGCVAGAAGVARMHDYLLAFPDHVGLLLAVELCSLTLQRDDYSVANLVATSLFGDGSAAVVGKGANRTPAGPRVLATRSRIYPDTEDVMGWDIGSTGFKIKLSTEVATVAEKYVGDDVRNFLNDHGLSTSDISTWVCHPGGPKVIEAIENTLDLPPKAMDQTRKSLRDNGNLSSVSVLDVLRANMADPPAPGSFGLMIAMGPAFCSELVLLGW
jgi:alkylresorcinol/alkylpyrone synthase